MRDLPEELFYPAGAELRAGDVHRAAASEQRMRRSEKAASIVRIGPDLFCRRNNTREMLLSLSSEKEPTSR